MIEIIKTILSLSVSGSILAVLLLILKPLYKNRLSCSWQYYIWLLVLLRMLLPITPEMNLIRIIAIKPTDTIITSDTFNYNTIESGAQSINDVNLPGAVELSPVTTVSDIKTGIETNPADFSETLLINKSLSAILPYLWYLFPFVTIFLILRMFLIYKRYTNMIKKDCNEIIDLKILSIFDEIRIEMKITRLIPVYKSHSIKTPMLIGIIKPIIILPVVNFSDDNYRMIFRHELIHYKRNDILYKWFVELMVCLHWFNPVIYFARKEIFKNCELSCDKAVLASLSATEKHIYGDALMALVNYCGEEKKYIASVGMNEDGKNIKERLSSIMFNSKSTTFVRLISGLLVLVLSAGAFFLGAYASSDIRAVESISWLQYYFEEIEIKAEDHTGNMGEHPLSPFKGNWFFDKHNTRFLTISINEKKYVQRLNFYSDTPLYYDENFYEPFTHMSYADNSHYFNHSISDSVSYDYVIKLYETDENEYWQLKDTAIIIQGQRDTYKALLDAILVKLNGSEYTLSSFDSFEELVSFLKINMEDHGAFAIFYLENVDKDDGYINYREKMGKGE